MRQELEVIRKEALDALEQAASLKELKDLKVRYLGKKGSLTALLRGMSNLTPEERPAMGQLVNEVRQTLDENFERREAELARAELEARLAGEAIDLTLPGREFLLGSQHLISRVTRELQEIFLGLGFTVADGPEIELDYYNFEALNLPKNHPARDMQDSFYISDEVLLRTHTSPVQVRVMQELAPELPVRIVVPGRVYRRDDDATHSPMFHQMEGLLVDKKVTFADLKGTLLSFARQMFGQQRQIRLRPSYFPFTEPSAEVDISCMICEGAGCRVCSGTGWLEILGSGMVHPRVLSMGGYDPEQVSGFAFGLGIERVVMLKYAVDDLRLLFENDLRFLEQF